MDEKNFLKKLKRDEILNLLINKIYFQAKERKMYNIMRIIREDEAFFFFNISKHATRTFCNIFYRGILMMMNLTRFNHIMTTWNDKYLNKTIRKK